MELPGHFKGKHFSQWVDHALELKRANQEKELEDLLLALVDATENEAHITGGGVAPWYYKQLAILYRKQKRKQDEVKILSRYVWQFKAPGAMPDKLLQRLQKLVK